jgi:hypothetical protein
MADQQDTPTAPGAASATYPIGARVSVPSLHRPGARIAATVTGYDDVCATVRLTYSGRPEVYLISDLADPVDYLTGQPVAPAPAPEVLTWQTQVARAREADHRPGAYNGQGACYAQRLTAAQCAEMTRDLEQMAVAS